MFEQSLKEGKVGESQIANWLKSRGMNILPVYEIEKGQYAGPAVYSSAGDSIIAPDMLCFGRGKTIWIEAKHKSAFSWYRIGQCWTTGIDTHHYYQYRKIMDLVDWPVWLLFLQKGGQAKDSPPSESGLFGNSLEYLMQHEDHRSDKHANGMVYWRKESLIKLSDYPLK